MLVDAAFRNPEINVRDFFLETTQGRINFDVSESDIHEVTFPADFKVKNKQDHQKFWSVVKTLPEFRPEWEQYDYKQFIVPENFRPFKVGGKKRKKRFCEIDFSFVKVLLCYRLCCSVGRYVVYARLHARQNNGS